MTAGILADPAETYAATAPTVLLGVHTDALDDPTCWSTAAGRHGDGPAVSEATMVPVDAQ